MHAILNLSNIYIFLVRFLSRVNLQQGSPIYECNSKCKCGPDCVNRVVQDGKSDHKLSIFRTSNNCGWGVKTLKVLFIPEYFCPLRQSQTSCIDLIHPQFFFML